ncbi:MAG: hypothetical protein A2147_10015 [Chloroflexi bacterium RBG_16_57_8]|nr:MAG: hypothetical protein A2147_10015 [Chloroflexi bacterium RBG_16_57_8]
METQNRVRHWLWALSLVALGACVPDKPPPQERILQADTIGLVQVWTKTPEPGYFIGPVGVTDKLALVTLERGFEGLLVAYTLATGDAVWEAPLSLREIGAISVDVSPGIVVITGIYGVTAYSTETGALLWRTQLGEGHVPVLTQLENDRARVYYGETLFEVALDDGRVEKSEALGSLVWRSSDVDLLRSLPNRTLGIERSTGKKLWERAAYTPTLSDNRPPQTLDSSDVIIPLEYRVCLLQLRTGEDKWCVRGVYMSNVELDSDKTEVYVLTEAFQLLQINALTGNIDGQAAFEPARLPGTGEHEEFLNFVGATGSHILIGFGDSNQLACLRRQ